MVFSAPSVVHADDEYIVDLTGTVTHNGIETTETMSLDSSTGRYSFGLQNVNQFATSSFTFYSGRRYKFRLNHFSGNTYVQSSDYPLVVALSLSDRTISHTFTISTSADQYGYFGATLEFEFDCNQDFTMSSFWIDLDGYEELGFGLISSSFTITEQSQTSIIGGFFAGLWNKLSGAFDKIGNWFSALGDRIQGFFTKLVEDIKGLFVPSDGYFDSKQAEISEAMQDHLGMVYQAGSLIDDLIQSVTTGTNKGTITFPTVKFQEYTIIETR